MNPEWTVEAEREVSDDVAVNFMQGFLKSTGLPEAGKAENDASRAVEASPKKQTSVARKYTTADTARILKGLRAQVRARDKASD
jgi:hypothetical protein